MAAEIDVRQELILLSKLQNVDMMLADLEQEKGDLPELVAKLKNEVERSESELEDFKTRVSESNKERRAMDGKIQLAKMKQEKYKEQTYSVSTNKEYDSLTAQIETLNEEIAEYEKTQYSLLEEEDIYNGKIKKLEENLEQLKNDLTEREGELEEKEQETESEELEYKNEREKLVVRIKKPIYAHYERIRVARRGIGAAPLYAGACGACYAVVPPQRQAEVRKMSDVILCESCGVILLPENEFLQGLDD